jgi:hypothetical protein
VIRTTHPNEQHKKHAAAIVDYIVRAIKPGFTSSITGALFTASYSHKDESFTFTTKEPIIIAIKQYMVAELTAKIEDTELHNGTRGDVYYKIKYDPDAKIQVISRTDNETVLYGWFYSPAGAEIDVQIASSILKTGLKETLLILRSGSVTQKYNKEEDAYEPAFRFEFDPSRHPGPVFYPGLLTANHHVYYKNIRIPYRLSAAFCEQFGMHNGCYKYFPDRTPAVAREHTCDCDEEKERAAASKDQRHAKRKAIEHARARKVARLAVPDDANFDPFI